MQLQPDSPNLVLLLVLGILPLLAGAALVVRGLRGRRRGDTPHCRRCDYALIGIDSGRCPECGAELGPKTVVRGERIRRPALVWAGVGALALGAAVTLLQGPRLYRSLDWYAMKPTGWVIDDAASPTPAVSLRAWREIHRRVRAGRELDPRLRDDRELSARDVRRLAELALAEQAAPTPGIAANPAVEWLGRAVVEGKVEPDQKDRFFRQMVRVTLRTRPKVVLGDLLPYRLDHQGRTPAGGSWWVKLRKEGVWLDGKLIDGPSGGSSGFSGMGAGGAWSSTVRCDTPGPHTVSVRVRVNIFHGPDAAGRDDLPPIHSCDLDASSSSEVVTVEPPDYVKVVTGAELGQQVRACLGPQRFEQDARSVGGEMKITTLPVGVAFDVFARAGGKEFPMGGITVPRGGSTNYFLRTRKFDAGRVDEIDLVLRSNPRLARQTVDLDDVWAGELVIEKVPVKQAK